MSNDRSRGPGGNGDQDEDKLAEPEFPPGLIPTEDDEPELTTEQSRAKATRDDTDR